MWQAAAGAVGAMVMMQCLPLAGWGWGSKGDSCQEEHQECGAGPHGVCTTEFVIWDVYSSACCTGWIPCPYICSVRRYDTASMDDRLQQFTLWLVTRKTLDKDIIDNTSTYNNIHEKKINLFKKEKTKPWFFVDPFINESERSSKWVISHTCVFDGCDRRRMCCKVCNNRP